MPSRIHLIPIFVTTLKPRMKNYKIVSNIQFTVVEMEVARLLNEGWVLAGGVSMVYKHEHNDHDEHIPGHLVYAQALEKDGE